MELELLMEQIKVVAEVREVAQDASLRRTEAYQKFMDDHEQLYTNERDAKATCLEAEDELRELTLKAYDETGNKAPAVGVGIREVTKLAYDPKEAFTWATDHKMALKLDTPAFEKIVKASPLDFVTITQEPQATIATKLEV